jgi:hypothetical protein
MSSEGGTTEQISSTKSAVIGGNSLKEKMF